MLKGKQKRFLRQLAHSLKPIINIGKGGVTESLIKQTQAGLLSHELIKVKVLEACPEDRYVCAEQLVQATSAELVQVIGRMVVLYRPHPEEPTIELPQLESSEA